MSELVGKDKDEMTLLIGNKEIICDAIKYIRTMDTCADAFTGIMPWEPGLDQIIDEVTAPYSYSECKLYIGNDLQSEMILYNVTPKLNDMGRSRELEGFSKTADLIDSSVRYPFEQNYIDLKQRIESQLNSPVLDRQFSDITVEVEEGIDYGGKFKRVVAKETENCFEKLKKLAAQRGCLLSCTKEGNILITRAKTDAEAVGTIYEDDGMSFEYSATFNGRARYKHYEAIASSGRKSKSRVRQTASDEVVTRSRFLTFSADESLPGGAKSAAVWRRNKSAANAMTLTFPVNSWYAPNDKLWDINTIVTVVSPTIGTGDLGFSFMIKQVTFNTGINDSRAVLELIPPTLYTTGEITEPWVN